MLFASATDGSGVEADGPVSAIRSRPAGNRAQLAEIETSLGLFVSATWTSEPALARDRRMPPRHNQEY